MKLVIPPNNIDTKSTRKYISAPYINRSTNKSFDKHLKKSLCKLKDD